MVEIHNLFLESTKDVKNTPDMVENPVTNLKYLSLLADNLEKANAEVH